MSDQGSESSQDSESSISPTNPPSLQPASHLGPVEAAADPLCLETCYQAALAAIGDVIYILGPDGKILSLSPAFEALTGWTASEFLGHSLESLVHPDDAAAARRLFQQVIAGVPTPVHELRVRTARGEYLIGELNAVMVRLPAQVRVLGIARDVTQRRRAEALLREQLEFERVLATISQGFLDSKRGEVGGWIRNSLQQLGEMFQADGAAFGMLDLETGSVARVHQWLRDPSRVDQLQHATGEIRLPHAVAHLAAERELVFSSLDEYPRWPEELAVLRQVGFSAGVAIPVIHDGNVLYWIAVVSAGPRSWPAESAARLRCVGQLLSNALARHQAEAKIRHEQQLLIKLLELQERDQQLIAHEVHDGFLQYALATHMHLQALARNLTTAGEHEQQTLAKAAQMLQRALAEGRRMLSGFRSVVLHNRGLVPAVEELVAEFKIHGGLYVALTTDIRIGRLDPQLENSAYRIVQEALNNVKRHSQTSHAAVHLSQRGDWLWMEIRDRGAGFDPDGVSDSCFGLRGIRERARLFGGKAVINTAPGRGTIITVDLPLVPPDGDQAIG